MFLIKTLLTCVTVTNDDACIYLLLIQVLQLPILIIYMICAIIENNDAYILLDHYHDVSIVIGNNNNNDNDHLLSILLHKKK